MEQQIEQAGRRQIGRVIQCLMDARGYTQRAFATEMQYAEPKLEEILYGQVILTRAVKVKIAKSLKLRPPEDRRQSGNWDPYSDLTDEALDRLFIDSVPEDEPRLSYLYKF